MAFHKNVFQRERLRIQTGHLSRSRYVRVPSGRARNSGSFTGREAHDDGATILVRNGESPFTWPSVAGSTNQNLSRSREMRFARYKVGWSTGKPGTWKLVGCPRGAVWGAVVGNTGHAVRWPPTLPKHPCSLPMSWPVAPLSYVEGACGAFCAYVTALAYASQAVADDPWRASWDVF